MTIHRDRRARGSIGSRGAAKGWRLLECLESRVLLSAVTVSPVTVTKGDTTTFATLTATLDTASSSDITLKYKTANNTAKKGVNYTATSAILTIPAGSTTATFTIPILSTDVYEGTTVFYVNLSSVSKGNKLQTHKAAVTILDNNAAPTVSLPDESVNAGTKAQTLSIPVTLSSAASKPVKISYATVNETALKGKNYSQAKGTLTIKPGATTGTIKVHVLKDTAGEQDNVFDVQLTSAKVATLATVAGGTEYARVVIRDDVGAGITRPTLTVADATVGVGDSETFNVTLSAATTRDVTVRYHTEPGTATAADYTPADGILTIPAGSTTGTITIATNSTGGLSSADFTLALTAPANADLTTATATGTILSFPDVAIAPASATEVAGNFTTQTMTFTVTLSSAVGFPVSVDYATADGTAIAGTDYTAASGTLNFAPGDTTKTFTVTVNGNSAAAAENFTVNLSNVSNGTLTAAAGVGTIAYALPTDLADNLSATTLEGVSVIGAQAEAASFTTGSASVNLLSVSVPLQMISAGTATMTIYSDSGGLPGAVVGTLTSPGSYSTDIATATFTANGAMTLSANTTYWVVMTTSFSGHFGWSATTGGDWAVSGDAGATWTQFVGATPQMQVLVYDAT